jgi:hypothetical protein
VVPKPFGFNLKLTGELGNQALLPDKLSLANPIVKLQEENILRSPKGWVLRDQCKAHAQS